MPAPVVGQGWTLNYEMFFYVLFAVSVFFPRRLAVASTSALLILDSHHRRDGSAADRVQLLVPADHPGVHLRDERWG